ncbi:MAG: peptidase [Spartobacteria bacterium]|nr:peptidase [Spartobacteria bacterium]
MAHKFKDILDALPEYRTAAESARETLLANLVMIGEIPAPSGQEDGRTRFLLDRFAECGLHNSSVDEEGNGMAILPGEVGEDSILLVAHLDTPFTRKDDHTLRVDNMTVRGCGVTDNSLGVAVLATLPTLLEKLNIHLNSDLMLMGASKSLGSADLRGLRFFLENNERPIRAGICIEGIELGRLSIGSIGMMRMEINCHVPEEYDWTRFGASGAILTINEVINKILEIAIPRRPRTRIVFGSVEGGKGFYPVSTNAVLRFEIRSDSAEMVKNIRRQIEDIVEELSSKTESDLTCKVLASRQPGGIAFNHPFSTHTRKILKRLGVEGRTSPSTSELSVFINHNIPAVTVGISTGEHLNQANEKAMIAPMFTGLAQLVGMLLAIDRGYCDATE